MKHLEQIKELVASEIGHLATIRNYTFVNKTKLFEEYEVSFMEVFNPICIRVYSDGIIQVRVSDFYELTSTIDSSCCYLYIALMNAIQEV